MKKVEAIVQASRLDQIKGALKEIGIEGMTVTEVRGHGRQKGHTEVYRGREYSVDLLPKLKIEMVLADDQVDRAIEALMTSARTGKIGDGKIFIHPIEDAIRIRNGQRGNDAL
jgi:nitrogen regulatory protein P-II 1